MLHFGAAPYRLSVLILVLCGSTGYAQVSFRGVGDLAGGPYESSIYGISGNGRVAVGASTASASSSDRDRGIYWTPQGGLVDIGDIEPNPPFENEVFAASCDGSVLVGQGHIGVDVGYWWHGGVYHRIVNPNNEHGADSVTAVSADGRTMAGWISKTSVDPAQAMRWTTDGSYLRLGDLAGGWVGSRADGISADGKVIVGRSGSANGEEAFRWSESEGMQPLGDLAGGDFYSLALAASGDGSVIVGQGTSVLGPEAMRWTAQTGMIGLGDLPGGKFYSVANAVSADGSVVVGSSDVSGGGSWPRAAFIWDASHGMRNLKDVLVNDLHLNLDGWMLTRAMAISADGLTIAGIGTNPDGNTEGWVARVPEPMSLCLLLPAILFCRRRR